MSVRPENGDYWECDIDWTAAARERMFRALILCGGYVTDFFHLGPLMPRNTLFMSVWLPRGNLEQFIEIAKPYEMRSPPVVKLNYTKASDE